MVVKEFSQSEIEAMGGLHPEKIVSWGIDRGLISADKRETYSFGTNMETRNLQRDNLLVGLGSFVLGRKGLPCYPMLGSRTAEKIRVFDLFDFPDNVNTSILRFLFVWPSSE
jgi:hypothetical protein